MAAGPTLAVPERPITLALFVSGLSGGGVPRVMLNLARAIARRGHRVDVVTPRPEGPLRALFPGEARLVPLVGWPSRLPWVAGKRRRQVVAAIPALVRYLRRERPAALLAADHWVNFSAVVARALAGVPTRVAVSQHTHLSRHAQARPIVRWLVPRLYPRADAIVAVSRGVADDLAVDAGIPRERITVIYNPVVTPEIGALAEAPVEHPWLAPGAPPVVLGAGRLVKQKDFPTLLRAFARVRAQRNVRLVVLGEGSRRADLERQARELGVADDVSLPGFVANPYAHMARAGLFVLSSAWEGFGNVLVEALACGCPVVSTDCPSGPAEILEGGAYGRLVPVGDDAALASAMLATLDTPPPAARLQARAADFTVERAARSYLALLERNPAGPAIGPYHLVPPVD